MDELIKKTLKNEFNLDIISIEKCAYNNFQYNYLINNSDNTSFFLRYMDSQKNINHYPGKISKLHLALNRNSKKGYKVPIWYSTNKREIIFDIDGINYILLEYLPRQNLTKSNWNINKVLDSLTIMHQDLREIIDHKKLNSFFNILDIEELNHCPENFYFIEKGIEKIINYSNYELLSNYKKQIIHGDFHSNNIFPTINNKIGIIDFFNSTYDTILFDYMELLDMFPEEVDIILEHLQQSEGVELTIRDFQYLKLVKAVYFLNQLNKNFKYNVRLKGGAATYLWSVDIIKNFKIK